MMKALMKWFVLLMALLLIVPCLAACFMNGKDDFITTVNGTTTLDGDNKTTTTSDGYTCSGGFPPSIDLEGYTYRAYVDFNIYQSSALRCEDFWVEHPGTDPLQIAVYDRNAAICADYNCNIVEINPEMSDPIEELTQMSTTENLDLLILRDTRVATAATKGLLADIAAYENIDLAGEWYDRNSIKQLAMGDKVYYLSGDMNISTMDSAIVTIFNEQLYAEKMPNGENLYQLVKDGKWTVEKMMEIAKAITVDRKEDGVLDATTSDGDIVGYFRYANSDLFYYYSCGGRISTPDEDGYPILTVDSEHSLEVIDLLLHTVNSESLPEGSPINTSVTRLKYFESEKTLFTDIALWDVRKSISKRINEWKYGILPTPMFEETGTADDYNSFVFMG
ncbi:MAG: hypothetical protein IJW92_06020, partial [Clostridia bacterium]|nr:hypothetical protein [Clostridia bacterium]